MLGHRSQGPRALRLEIGDGGGERGDQRPPIPRIRGRWGWVALLDGSWYH